MGTQRSLGAPPGRRPPFLLSPRRALPAAAAGHSGTAHLQTHAVPAVQALSMPGRPVSPRGDGGGCPRPRWWGPRAHRATRAGLGSVPGTSPFSGSGQAWSSGLTRFGAGPLFCTSQVLVGTLDIRLSSAGHPHVSTPRLCWVSLSGLFRAGPLAAAGGTAAFGGLPSTPHGAAPHLLAPTLPPPPASSCRLAPPPALAPAGHRAFSTAPPLRSLLGPLLQDHLAKVDLGGGVLPGPGGQGSLPDARPYSTHQDPLPGQKVGVGYVCLGPPDPGWQNEDLTQALLGP